MNQSLNTKFSDSNGDGFVSDDDVNAILDNYNGYHSLLQSDYLSVADYPFILIPQSTELDSGDVLVIDIAIGNATYPVENLDGLAFSLNLPSELVDSSSLNIQFSETSWFVLNSPSIQMSKTLADGYVEGGIGRVNRVSSNGYGIIGQAVCIIEEEIDDTRLIGQRIPMTIKLEGGTALDGNGNKVRLPNAETTVFVNLNKEKTGNIEEQLICYPNPSSTFINIHFNGQNIIESYKIYDMQGRLMMEESNLNTNHKTVQIDAFETGIYILEVQSPKGNVSKKLKVIN